MTFGNVSQFSGNSSHLVILVELLRCIGQDLLNVARIRSLPRGPHLPLDPLGILEKVVHLGTARPRPPLKLPDRAAQTRLQCFEPLRFFKVLGIIYPFSTLGEKLRAPPQLLLNFFQHLLEASWSRLSLNPSGVSQQIEWRSHRGFPFLYALCASIPVVVLTRSIR